MKPSRISTLLDDAARQHIPDNRDLLPEILARLQPQEKKNMKLKLVVTVLAVILGLGLITGVGYAVYRAVFGDPGIEAVQEAGLVNPVQQTANPTLQPQLPTPAMLPEAPLHVLGQTQTVQGVTWTLEWLQINRGGVQLGFSMSGSPNMPTLPNIQIGGRQIEPQGQILWLWQESSQWTGLYRAFWNLPVSGNGLSLQFGLEEQAGPTFDLTELPIEDGRMPTGEYIQSVRVDDRQLDLKAVVLGPQSSWARVCAAEGPTPDWSNLTIAAELGPLGQAPRLRSGLQGQPQPVPQAPACADLHFDLPNNEQSEALHLTLTPAAGSTWEFYAEAPTLPAAISPHPTATPLAAQAAGPVTVTLDWAYADAQRVAMQLHFSGWQSTYTLWGATLQTSNGQTLDLNTAQPSSQDGNTYLLIFNAQNRLAEDTVQLTLNLPIQDINDWQTVLAAFQFQISLPVYPATEINDVQAVTANGLTLRLEKADIAPSYTRVILCYDKPTRGPGSDWGVAADTQLQGVALLDYVLLQDADAGIPLDPQGNFSPSQPADRCIALGFPIGSVQQPQGTLTLIIPGLENSIPEAIPNEAWAAAQQKLAAQGIQVEQYTFSANGGGGGGWNILQRPDGMSDEQVYQLVKEALGYTFPGPWIFTLPLP